MSDDVAPVPDASGRGAITARWYATRSGLSTSDVGGLILGLLLLVAFAPPLIFDSWTPRMAILMGCAPIGVLLLVGLCGRRDRAAVALSLALLWAVFTAIVSSDPRSALIGFVGRDLSTLTVVAAAGCWAIGRTMSARGSTLMVLALIWGGTLGGAVGVLQVLFDVTTGPLALFDGRPTSFYSNPVYFGAITAATFAAAAATWSRERWRAHTVPLVVGGLATSLSGSRVALGAALVVLLLLVGLRRSRQSALSAGLGSLSLIAGVALDRLVGAGRNAADRLAETAGSGRTQVWRYGLEAWADRPLTGYGFGRFRPAVQGRFSTEFVRDFAPDDLTQAWFDPHNVVISVLVAVGAVGAVFVVAWVAIALRATSGGALLWALLALVLHWGLQPVSLFTLPLAMLLFGAASHPLDEPLRASRVHAAGLAVGLVIAVGLVSADLALRLAADDADGDRAANVAMFYFDDPVVSDIVAQVYVFDPAEDSLESELRWRRQAAESEPDRPFWWSQLGRTQLLAGRIDASESSIDRALSLQPTNARALRTEVLLALESEDVARVERAIESLCRVSPADCDLDADELLDEYLTSNTAD